MAAVAIALELRPTTAFNGHLTEEVLDAQRGDTKAFESLYRANAGRVFALCLRLAANRDRAELLTQDAFVRAWEQLHSFRGEAAFSTWMHRLTVNLVTRSLQTQQIRGTRESTREGFDELPASTHPVHAESIDLEKAIARLPEQARIVFVLHDVEGFRHEEIAEQLGVAVGTSKSQLHRARQLLREVLK
jgi:RNA polymerase sigma-70 factor (ECF subfamily)